MGILSAARGRRLRPLLRALALCCALTASGGAAAQSGDAFGDGSLRPPTGPRFADPSWYDLVDVALLAGDPVRIALTLGAIDGSGGLALGITQPILEVYVDSAEGGAEALLPGSGLAMPLGTGWQVAIRVTGDGAWAWEADADGVVDLAAPIPVEVVVDGTTITVLTPFARPEEEARLYAVSGVYDPFRADGWRPLSREPSPWAFSSDQQQTPVVDVFPGDPSERAAALARGELPRAQVAGGIAPGSLVWVWLMGAGVALALAGLVLRTRPVRRAATATARDDAPPADDPPARYVTVALPTMTEPPAGEVELIDDSELPSAPDDTEPVDAAVAQSVRVAETAAFPPAPLALPAPRPDAFAADASTADPLTADAPAEDAAATDAPDVESPTRSSETEAPSEPSRDAKRS